MKTLKRVPLQLIEVEFIPKIMEFGKFYYSQKYNVSNHLCVCGCGCEAPVPIKDGEWSLSNANGKLTVTPSLHHRHNCQSHYIITDGVANIVNEPIPKSNWYPSYDTHAPGSCPL